MTVNLPSEQKKRVSLKKLRVFSEFVKLRITAKFFSGSFGNVYELLCLCPIVVCNVKIRGFNC